MVGVAADDHGLGASQLGRPVLRQMSGSLTGLSRQTDSRGRIPRWGDEPFSLDFNRNWLIG